MISKILIALGMWTFCDALFSLYSYLGKEGIKENSIRVVRLIVAIIIMTIGFIL